MTKPALWRPRTFELLGGLVVVTLLAGLVISRSGPRSTTAEQPEREARVPIGESARGASAFTIKEDRDALRQEDSFTVVGESQRPLTIGD